MSLHGILSQDFSSSAIKIVLGNLEEYIRFIGQSIRPISFYNFDNYTVLTKVNVLVFSPKHHTEVFQGTGHHVSNLLAVKKKKKLLLWIQEGSTGGHQTHPHPRWVQQIYTYIQSSSSWERTEG